MKKILAILPFCLLAVSAPAQDGKSFKTVCEIPVTSVKNDSIIKANSMTKFDGLIS